MGHRTRTAGPQSVTTILFCQRLQYRLPGHSVLNDVVCLVCLFPVFTLMCVLLCLVSFLPAAANLYLQRLPDQTNPPPANASLTSTLPKQRGISSFFSCLFLLVGPRNKQSVSQKCIMHPKTTKQSLKRTLTISYQKRLFTGSFHNSSYLIKKRQILKDHESKCIVSEGKWIFEFVIFIFWD